jgi:uronate dehydrogenase
VDTVLITGAAGRVGTAVRPLLRDRFRLRCFDLRPAADPGPGEQVIVGDLNSRRDLQAALDGVDAVLHLACVHGHGLTFEASLDVNYRAVVTLLEATRAAGVTRLVYASSHHVLGAHRRAGFDAGTLPLAPDAFYGLGKAFGELACSMYAHRYGLRTLVVRIGNADPEVADDRTLRLWVSARDLAQLFAIGLTHPGIGFDVVYGVSECPSPLFPNPAADRLGYRPADRAVDHLAPDFTPYESMPARSGRDYVGGGYVAVNLPSVSGEDA